MKRMAGSLLVFFIVIIVTGCASFGFKKDTMLTVFFEEEMTEQQKQEIGDTIAEKEIVYDIRYVSAEEAWEEFKETYMGDNPELAAGFGEDNPLANADNYEVYVKATKSEINKLVSDIQNMKGVLKVNESDYISY